MNVKYTVLIVLAVAASIAAVSFTDDSDAASDLQIKVDGTVNGNSAVVEVILENNPGIWSIKMTLDYPSDAMTLRTSDIVPGDIVDITVGADDNGAYGIYGEASGLNDSKKNGVLLTFKFDVKADMGSSQIAVLLTDIEIFNVNAEEVGCSVVSTAIASGRGILGDVDGNGIINGLDSLALKKYLAKWNNPIVKQNTDTDKNGKINGLDSLLIKKHLAKIDVGLGTVVLAGDAAVSVHYDDSVQKINGVISDRNLIIPLYGTIRSSDIAAGSELTINIGSESEKCNVTVVANPGSYGTVKKTSYIVDYGTKLSAVGNVLAVGDYGATTATPAVSALGDYTYSFVGWSNVPAAVTKDVVIYANFARTPLKYAVNVIFTCEGKEIVPGISSAQDYGVKYTYNYMWYPGYPSKGVPAAPAAFEEYVLTSAEQYTITVQANPTGSKIVNTIEFTFDHVKKHVMLWLQGDPGYNLSFDVNYGDDFNQVIQAYGDNVGKKMGIAFEEYGTYSYAPIIATHNGSTLTLNVIDSASTEIVFGPITDDVILYYNYSNGIVTNNRTVAFDSNGGFPNPEPQTVKYGEKATKPSSPTKNGYVFRGWFTSPSGGSKFNFSTTPITSNITLYAHWDNQCKVTVIASPAGYGTADKVSYTVNYGTKLTVSDNILTVGGYGATTATPAVSTLGDYNYCFVGWDNVPSIVTKDLVVYAIFDRIPLKYAVNVIFTCNGEEIVPGVSSAQDFGAVYTYNYMDYPGYPGKGVPAAPAAFEGYVLTSAEEYTITVQANPTGSKIVNTIEFTFDHVKKHVMLWLQGDPRYNLSFDVNYGDDFNQVVGAYGDNVGKKMGIAFEEYGTYSYAPATITHGGSTLTLNVIDTANTEVVFGPITEDVILYYNYL